MNVWISFSKDTRRKKLNTNEETRWGLGVFKKVFGHFAYSKDGLYFELLLILQYFAISINIQPIKEKSFLDS